MSFDNDLGRVFEIGRLLFRTPTEDWTPTPFLVVKSLSEGGFWVIARRDFEDRDPDYPPFPQNDARYEVNGRFVYNKFQTRSRRLEGVGDLAVARLPDNVVSTFALYRAKDREALEVMIAKGDVGAQNAARWQADKDSSMQLDFQRQYCGGFQTHKIFAFTLRDGPMGYLSTKEV
ncbi:MAG: hypothetical protein Q9165_004314 [Trypethelium subeluteriae]